MEKEEIFWEKIKPMIMKHDWTSLKQILIEQQVFEHISFFNELKQRCVNPEMIQNELLIYFQFDEEI